MLKKMQNYFIYFMIFATSGWIYEVLWNTFILGMELENRGFLFGPYLPIYGFGGLLLLFLLNKFMKRKIKIGRVNITPILVLIAIFLITTVVEYVGHYVMDTYFNIILWDYSKDYLNIDGRVCFAASRNFAVLGFMMLYFIYPALSEKLEKMKTNKRSIISLVLFAIIMIDLIIKFI